MRLTNDQIYKIKSAYHEANKAEQEFLKKTKNLSSIISKITGIDVSVDHFPDDGFGITPKSNDDTHISVEFLLESAAKGIDITEEWMLHNLSF